ncbi:hypothetical protein FSP39_024785 [Pinctada imbricata]|uniref:Uncharacterized protein n=1 Tax=Pinctada imbricata TaxID=66713 RepID=A0AA88YVY6_PINIB|nr:hypothetical protein FSP39_024785 [Pinctada imbricata]
MSGNRRHKLTCRISNVKNIECENIIWERLDTSEQFRIEKVNPGYAFKCEENSADNSATVELEILEVKEEHFKVEWAVMYQLGEGLFSQREITTIQQLNAASSLYGLASMILSVAAVVFLL